MQALLIKFFFIQLLFFLSFLFCCYFLFKTIQKRNTRSFKIFASPKVFIPLLVTFVLSFLTYQNGVIISRSLIKKLDYWSDESFLFILISALIEPVIISIPLLVYAFIAGFILSSIYKNLPKYIFIIFYSIPICFLYIFPAFIRYVIRYYFS